jgi:ABC-type nitrate/sulfonate/bicarbonate transport system substrate-binding protein
MVTLHTALGKYFHTMPLFSGDVAVRDVTLDFEELPTGIGPALRPMIRNFEFDMSELGLSTALSAKEWGIPLASLPIFVFRSFDFGAFMVNGGASVDQPKDLEGKRVAIRSYTIANAIWARGFLADSFGVDLDSITWVVTGDEHVAWSRLPANCELRPGGDAIAMLEAGEVAGILGAYSGSDGRIRQLVPDAENRAKEWLRTKGPASIHRVVVIQDRHLEEHPELAGHLYGAFVDAKRPFLDRLAQGDEILEHPEPEVVTPNAYGTTHTSELPRPDPVPYGVDDNRELLETFLRYAYDQHVISRRMSVEEWFSPVE